VRITLRRRNPRVAENLLNNSYMYALRDQQGRGGVPGIMDSDVPNLSLPENAFPGSPVLSSLDRAAMTSSEDEVIVTAAGCGQRARSGSES